MKYLSLKLDSLKKAQRTQNKLYNKYNHVRLISFPCFSEAGLYIWEVK